MLKIHVVPLNDMMQAQMLSKNVARIHVKTVICCLERINYPAGQKRMIVEEIVKNGKA